MIILFFLLPLFSFAHIIQDDVSIVDKSRHSFKSVCSKAGYPESPLIEVLPAAKLDCMGRKVDAGDFCDNELVTDPYFIRAYIDKPNREVICVSGKKVLFKYLCVKLTDRDMCSARAEVSCKYIQKKLARRLDMVHSSFTKNDKGIKQLNCFFESLPLSEKHGL